jgi:lambda repressor-like predicted transcriptional regulator
MDKPLEVSDMPVLTDAEHTQLRVMEHELRVNLAKCVDDRSVRDHDAAFEYARTAAVSFYDFFYRKYTKHPDQTYRPHWRPASEKFAYQRVVRCLDNFSALESLLHRDDRAARLKKTISENAAFREPRLMTAVMDAPKIPTLMGTPTDSPLPQMAKFAQSFNLVAHKRKAFVQPLLDAKGWSLAQWAEKAKVSRHTANSYMEGKRKTYHSSMKDLAEALGVSFQEFPK